VRCARFAPDQSTAYDPATKKIALPWRGDLPESLPTTGQHGWKGIKLTDWQAYMAAVLSEIRAATPRVTNARLSMAPDAKWWISPWMDFTANGREPMHGLTRERGPDVGDLAPDSPSGYQVWAVGFYNEEGAYGLGQVFADPCDPKIPNVGWTFPEGSASFKFLFTNAPSTVVPYLDGSPEIDAFIDKPGGGPRSRQRVRLIQVDIAVRDNDAPSGWVFGTYIWKGPRKGDGLLDNLEPVGMMWGNDSKVAASPRDAFATLEQTRLNPALAGVVWRGTEKWDTRPWPGFQGRLNGPADNMRSSCMSCHALAQWPRSRLGIVPTSGYSMAQLNTAATRDKLRLAYMRDVPGGTLTVPEEVKPSADRDGAVSLDYSLQVEAGMTRICSACASGALTGATPAMCKVRRPNATVITTPSCPAPKKSVLFSLAPAAGGNEAPPRQ
jgi:hypothetical protein